MLLAAATAAFRVVLCAAASALQVPEDQQQDTRLQPVGCAAARGAPNKHVTCDTLTEAHLKQLTAGAGHTVAQWPTEGVMR
jgi:hypothetical protein